MCTKDMYDVVGSSSALPENFWFPFLCLSFFLKCIVNLLLQILKLVENAKIEMRRFQKFLNNVGSSDTITFSIEAK